LIYLDASALVTLLARRTYANELRDLVNGFTEILLTEEVRDAAAHLPGALRTLDAIHVASAQVLGDSLDMLVTYDKRMLDVARAEGLPAEAPGLL
jgi:predicted nucleic acid-binding protein